MELKYLRTRIFNGREREKKGGEFEKLFQMSFMIFDLVLLRIEFKQTTCVLQIIQMADRHIKRRSNH